MFEGLAKGLGQGPSNATILTTPTVTQTVPEGYTAEPAKVMVMVQNTRAVEAETKLQKLKSIITLIVCIVFVLFIFALWRYFRREPKAEYFGKPLPGAPLQQQDMPAVAPVAPQMPLHQAPMPQLPMPQVAPKYDSTDLIQKPNVVKIIGQIPLWTKEDYIYDEPEPRVSESDSSIAVLVKQRETFTKDLELSMARAQQTQNEHT